jgi:hypothetical protein
MTPHRILIAAAALFAVLAAPAFAQTQPPGGFDSDKICVYDGVHPGGELRPVRAGTASIYPYGGTPTEGNPVQAVDGSCDSSTVTPTPTVGVDGQRATPLPTATLAPTVEPTATPEPTWTPEPTATPEWPAKEPTMPAGPLPSCTPERPIDCGGK